MPCLFPPINPELSACSDPRSSGAVPSQLTELIFTMRVWKAAYSGLRLGLPAASVSSCADASIRGRPQQIAGPPPDGLLDQLQPVGGKVVSRVEFEGKIKQTAQPLPVSLCEDRSCGTDKIVVNPGKEGVGVSAECLR